MCTELTLRSQSSPKTSLSQEVESSPSLEVCKKRVVKSWQKSCGIHPSLSSGRGEENQMVLGIPSSPGSHRVVGEQGKGWACGKRWAV